MFPKDSLKKPSVLSERLDSEIIIDLESIESHILASPQSTIARCGAYMDRRQGREIDGKPLAEGVWRKAFRA